MNQILSFGKEGKIEKQKSKEIKPIIKFFVGVLIVFAIIIICMAVYNMFFSAYKNKSIPSLAVVQDGSNAIITLEYAEGIDKILYSWNNGEEAIILVGGKNKTVQKIQLPIGENELFIKVIDNSGRMTQYNKQSFNFDSTVDTNKPVIEIAKGTGTGTIKIIVTDDVGLKNVSYQWSEDDLITPEIPEDSTKFEMELAAKEGERTLKVVAQDLSENQQSVVKTIKGSKKPEIKVSKVAEELVIKLNDDDKIVKLEVDFNGQVDTIENINEKTYEYRVRMVKGENRLIVKAYDIDGLMAEYKGKAKL